MYDNVDIKDIEFLTKIDVATQKFNYFIIWEINLNTSKYTALFLFDNIDDAIIRCDELIMHSHKLCSYVIRGYTEETLINKGTII